MGSCLTVYLLECLQPFLYRTAIALQQPDVFADIGCGSHVQLAGEPAVADVGGGLQVRRHCHLPGRAFTGRVRRCAREDPNGVRSWGLGLTGGPDGERGI